MDRRGAWLAALALILGTVAPAGAAQVVDMAGRRVAVPAAASRVVSLAPSLTETVYAVGAADRLVGVTDYCDFPPEATKKPRVGGIYNPSVETILGLRPDLVLATTEGNREEDVRELEELGVAVYVVRPVDFASVLDSIVRVGGLMGRKAEARRVVKRLGREAESIARALAGVRRPRVLYVLWGSPLIVPGRETLITDLIRRAGGESVTGDEPVAYPQFSLEEALARAPERIVIARHGNESVEERLREWRGLGLLPAARQGRVQAIDGDLLHRPGPRIVDGLRALARLIHPEVAW